MAFPAEITKKIPSKGTRGPNPRVSNAQVSRDHEEGRTDPARVPWQNPYFETWSVYRLAKNIWRNI